MNLAIKGHPKRGNEVIEILEMLGANRLEYKDTFVGFYDIDFVMNYPYECCRDSFAQCIPYEGNEHLIGTTNDCDNFYKTWE